MTADYQDISDRLARLEERVEGMRTSTDVAKDEIDRRLDDMNELRRQIEAERGRYIDVDRYDERHEELQKQLNRMENRVAAMEGGNVIKAGTIGWGLAGLGVLVTVVAILVNVLTSGV
jgi:predicted RNase H-like nuclease (RuvC/YqgF family)